MWITNDTITTVESTALYVKNAVYINRPINIDLVLTLEKGMFTQFFKDVYTVKFTKTLRWVFPTEEERDLIYDRIVTIINCKKIEI